MFEFFFKHSLAVFTRGDFVLLSRWPAWVLLAACGAAALALGSHVWRHRAGSGLPAWRLGAIWGLQAALVALVLLLLWHPAMSVTTLKPQQNIIAVMIDDSRSMAIRESGQTRLDAAVSRLNGGLLE